MVKLLLKLAEIADKSITPLATLCALCSLFTLVSNDNSAVAIASKLALAFLLACVLCGVFMFCAIVWYIRQNQQESQDNS